jgi:hypothetical protein
LSGYPQRQGGFLVSRSSLYIIIGALIALVLAFGVYLVWQENQRPGLEIRLNDQGISVDGN